MTVSLLSLKVIRLTLFPIVFSLLLTIFMSFKFQANAKLFLFEATTQTWIEKGRGTIRLNDMSSDDERTFQSRLGNKSIFIFISTLVCNFLYYKI